MQILKDFFILMMVHHSYIQTVSKISSLSHKCIKICSRVIKKIILILRSFGVNEIIFVMQYRQLFLIVLIRKENYDFQYNKPHNFILISLNLINKVEFGIHFEMESKACSRINQLRIVWTKYKLKKQLVISSMLAKLTKSDMQSDIFVTTYNYKL